MNRAKEHPYYWWCSRLVKRPGVGVAGRLRREWLRSFLECYHSQQEYSDSDVGWNLVVQGPVGDDTGESNGVSQPGAGDVNPVLTALFGNRTAACVLLFLQSYGEGHAMRIAATFGFGLNMTQRQLRRLEGEGVLLSRRVGNVRLFSFNQRNATVRNLQQLLEAELQLLPQEVQERFFRQRQRPRLSDKPLLLHA